MAIGVDPCPFCGSPASVTEIFTGSGAYVECDACDAAGPESKKREDAVRLWNTRHVTTPVKSESADCQKGTQLVDIVRRLAIYYSDTEVLQWLCSPHPQLNDQPPAWFINDGNPEPILSIIDRLDADGYL